MLVTRPIESQTLSLNKVPLSETELTCFLTPKLSVESLGRVSSTCRHLNRLFVPLLEKEKTGVTLKLLRELSPLFKRTDSDCSSESKTIAYTCSHEITNNLTHQDQIKRLLSIFFGNIIYCMVFDDKKYRSYEGCRSDKKYYPEWKLAEIFCKFVPKEEQDELCIDFYDFSNLTGKKILKMAEHIGRAVISGAIPLNSQILNRKVGVIDFSEKTAVFPAMVTGEHIKKFETLLALVRSLYPVKKPEASEVSNNGHLEVVRKKMMGLLSWLNSSLNNNSATNSTSSNSATSSTTNANRTGRK